MTHEEMIASGQHECASDCPPLMTQPLRPQAEPRTARVGVERWADRHRHAGIWYVREDVATEQSVPLPTLEERLEAALADLRKIGPDNDLVGAAERHVQAALLLLALEMARGKVARLVDGSPKGFGEAQATPQPACTCDSDPAYCHEHVRPAAHPAGSADTALPLGSTSNGALDNAQGPNQLRGNVATPTQSADTALREALERQYRDLERFLAISVQESMKQSVASEIQEWATDMRHRIRAALAAQPTLAARPKGSEEDS